MIATVATRYVVNLGHSVRIPLGEGRQFKVGETSIAVFRTRDGGVYATQAMCPHKSGPLADSLLGGQRIVCPLHAYAFDVKTGAAHGHNCGSIRTFPASINPRGEIVVSLDLDGEVQEHASC